MDGEGAHAVESRGLPVDGAGGRPGGAPGQLILADLVRGERDDLTGRRSITRHPSAMRWETTHPGANRDRPLSGTTCCWLSATTRPASALQLPAMLRAPGSSVLVPSDGTAPHATHHSRYVPPSDMKTYTLATLLEGVRAIVPDQQARLGFEARRLWCAWDTLLLRRLLRRSLFIASSVIDDPTLHWLDRFRTEPTVRALTTTADVLSVLAEQS